MDTMVAEAKDLAEWIARIVRRLTASLFCHPWLNDTSRARLMISMILVSLGFQADTKAAPNPQPAHFHPLTNFIWTVRHGTGEPPEKLQTMDQWQPLRSSILDRMQSIMGPLPSPITPTEWDLAVQEEIDGGTYVRRLISIRRQADAEPPLPAYLLIPKAALGTTRNTPAVLTLHPTDNINGHKVVVGLGGKENRNYAQELAERGFVTLAPAYPLLANYQPDWRALGYQSGTMKAIRDNIMSMDYLTSLPFVRTNSFGAIGHSLGGHNAVFTAAFDPRISVVISSCGLDSFRDYKNGDIRGWTSDRYMPSLLEYRDCLDDIPFDFHEIIAALAPRHCLLIAPFGDSNFQWQSVDLVAGAARKIYELHGAGDRLQVEHPDCDHDFPDEARERAYELLDKVLRGDR